MFADAIYEAIPLYRGRSFLPERHYARLARGLGEVAIQFDVAGLEGVCDELVSRNELADAEFAVFYLQITRGVAPRTHAFPVDPVSPTVYAFARALVRATPARWDRGYAAITVPDQRWGRADIKCTALLPNVLAQQAAVDAGVADAIFVRDEMVLEGTHNNLFMVLNGMIVTAPTTHQILHGVTRGFVLELAAGLGLPAEERPIPLAELRGAEEIFFTGTTTEIRPTVELDGQSVGAGVPGPVTRELYEHYRCRVDDGADSMQFGP